MDARPAGATGWMVVVSTPSCNGSDSGTVGPRTSSATPPKRLFTGACDLDNSAGGAGGIPNYDVTPDGQRFLMVKMEGMSEEITRPLIVVLNWHQELLERVPIA